jgi:hypothetical protein
MSQNVTVTLPCDVTQGKQKQSQNVSITLMSQNVKQNYDVTQSKQSNIDDNQKQ